MYLKSVVILLCHWLIIFFISTFSSFFQFAVHEPGITHVLVTGGAGFIGSHATLRLLKDNYRVTIVVCLFIHKIEWFSHKSQMHLSIWSLQT